MEELDYKNTKTHNKYKNFNSRLIIFLINK